MSTLRPSIKKQFVDRLVTRLKGDDDLARPDGLDDCSVDKDRRILTLPVKTARISVYALKQQQPDPQGSARRPILMSRTVVIEARVLVVGDEDTMDAFEQWVTQCFATAGTLGNLILSAREDESSTMLAEDSAGSVLMWLSRWAVEFTTLPADLSSSGRNTP